MDNTEQMAEAIEKFMAGVPGDADNEREWSSEDMSRFLLTFFDGLGFVQKDDQTTCPYCKGNGVYHGELCPCCRGIKPFNFTTYKSILPAQEGK